MKETGEPSSKTALLVIDVQRFYFPGGAFPLVEPEPASLNAKKLLEAFRRRGGLMVHVRTAAPSGMEFHPNVEPAPGEKVITKSFANSFRETDLLEYLRGNGVERLVICGMMTHMCVEAATRAASDFGFECLVAQDACTTRDLTFRDRTVPARDVHCAALSALAFGYARIVDTEDLT